MNRDYFRIIEAGMEGELGQLSLAETVRHLKNHLANYLLDDAVSGCYLDRFFKDQDLAKDREAGALAFYLLAKHLQLAPFSLGALRTANANRPDQDLALRIEVLDKTNPEPETFGLIDGLDLKNDAAEAREFCVRLLKYFPSHVLAANKLLDIDFFEGRSPGDWLGLFKCPRAIAKDWDARLFNHLAAVGDLERALDLWPRLSAGRPSETSLNLAAEVFRRAGDVERARALYRESLALDPAQVPVRLRLGEIESPTRPRPELVREKGVCVYLYSYNKADSLGRTLESLGRSEIGPARIKVLLNGCTDHSRAVAEAARARFPDNDFEIIELPVNVGAPAARNWLISHPDTWKGDYVAFVDDDVDLQADWLGHFLTVAESDPKVAVVGCKVVFPGRPAMYQYLFRYVSIARPDMIKLSLDVPVRQFDNGLYDFVRRTRNVMGCQHLLRTGALRDAPRFDIRFSPTQIDDIDHDLELCLKGHSIVYCGLVTCVHHQRSGHSALSGFDYDRTGNCVGNDIKFQFKHFAHVEDLAGLDNLSLDPG
ncbi:MAG: glycosyltransferase [Desulfovibrionaceae bacterium]|nr:glycosyltransferase [Desulfovibrionaceae bacterium]